MLEITFVEFYFWNIIIEGKMGRRLIELLLDIKKIDFRFERKRI